jgi:hypothetical protein
MLAIVETALVFVEVARRNIHGGISYNAASDQLDSDDHIALSNNNSSEQVAS